MLEREERRKGVDLETVQEGRRIQRGDRLVGVQLREPGEMAESLSTALTKALIETRADARHRSS